MDPKIQIKYIDTKNQLADILTKGNFTRDEWNHLLCLFNISHFSSTVCSEAMTKRVQQDSGEEGRWIEIGRDSRSRCVDLIVLVLGNTIQNHDRTGQPVVGHDKSHKSSQQSRGMFNVLNNVERVPSNSNFRITKLCFMCLRTTKQ